MNKRLEKIRTLARSPKGKNTLVFLSFFVLSAILWVVQSLNEDVQTDLRYNVRITNVPDSLVRVSPLPEAINVSILAKGTDLMKYYWTQSPEMVIDYRRYKSGNRLMMGEAAIKSFIRNMVGATCQVQSVNPDSLSIAFTSYPGQRMPVKLNVHVIPERLYVMRERVRAIQDSVMLYSLDGKRRVTSLSTDNITLTDVSKDMTFKVPVIVPPNCRAVPDSVEVAVKVEPLVSKTRKVNVTTVNVPHDEKLIPVPSIVEVMYMLPMSQYKANLAEPKFQVIADYRNTLNADDTKIPITLKNVDNGYINVFLTTDSVDYIIVKK